MALPRALAEGKFWSTDSLRLVGLLLVAAGAVYFVLLLSRPAVPAADVRKFTGVLTSIEGDRVTLYGAFYPVPEPVPEKFLPGRNFTFRTDEATKMLSILLYRTPPERIIANGGRYRTKLSGLPRTEQPGSLQELKQLLGSGIVNIEVSFPSSILAARNPVAATLIYRYLPTPNFQRL